jgi:ribosome biogenesis GTPase / thiamine phosphate phosphatase
MTAAEPTVGPHSPNDDLALAALGWGESFAAAFVPHAADGRRPGRVIAEDRGLYVVATAAGEVRAAISGRFRFDTGGDPTSYPSVGDWVALDLRDDGGTIHAVLPRRSAFARLGAGKETRTQIVGANVDVVFIVTSLNHDFNLRRLERYLASAWDSGARPVVLLSKADLASDVDGSRLAAQSVAPGVPVLVVSAVDGTGLEEVRAHLAPGRTLAIVGSSGVGKSTLINALAGRPIQAVAEIRLDDGRGRHTTIRRELLRLDDGALVLDTPGMREFALDDDDGLASSFADLEEIAARCRFADCAHGAEPGCAVKTAIRDGILTSGRVDAYVKLRREALHAERRHDALARIAERRRWKVIHKSVQAQMRERYGDGR